MVTLLPDPEEALRPHPEEARSAVWKDGGGPCPLLAASPSRGGGRGSARSFSSYACDRRDPRRVGASVRPLDAVRLLPYVRPRDTPPHRGAPIWKGRPMSHAMPAV